MKSIKIRSLSKLDGPDFFEIVSDRKTALAAAFEVVHDIDAANQLLMQELATANGFAVDVNNLMVGCIFLYPQADSSGFPDVHNLEIGFMMNPKYQNQGIMGTAVNQLMQFIKRQNNVKSVVASIERTNLASKRVLVKNGFVAVGNFNGLFGQSLTQFQLTFVK